MKRVKKEPGRWKVRKDQLEQQYFSSVSKGFETKFFAIGSRVSLKSLLNYPLELILNCKSHYES